MPPERPDLVLATHVPHGETDIFKFYRLHIKTFTEEEEALNTAKHWREPSKNHNWTSSCKRKTKGKSLTDGWDGSYNFTQLQFVQDGRFSRSIQSNCRETTWFKYKSTFILKVNTSQCWTLNIDCVTASSSSPVTHQKSTNIVPCHAICANKRHQKIIA